MKWIRIIAWIGLLAMTVVLLNGFITGDFTGEGNVLLGMSWGIVSLVDLYAGFALFSCWVAYREKNLLRAIIWIILMMVLGFWAGCLYTLLASYRAGDDVNKLLLGKHAK